MTEEPCPHCGRTIDVTQTSDMSGCARIPQCPPQGTMTPSDAWPMSDDDGESTPTDAT